MQTFTSTMAVLSFVDSLIPITSTVEISATISTAGRFTRAPVMLSPACTHPAIALATSPSVHQAVGNLVSPGGRVIPKGLRSDTRCPDQPPATVEAPAAYSSTGSQ